MQDVSIERIMVIKMFEVISKDSVLEFATLDLAMAHAKTMNEFVTIKGNGFEVVGPFGVDSVKDGLCPDGVAYDWNKASRIGRVKKERNELCQVYF
jgi:hypothetical protein